MASFDDGDYMDYPDYQDYGSDPDQQRASLRQPPHDSVAERGVLGSLLLNPDRLVDITNILHPDDFYEPRHQLIFEAILDLSGNSKAIDSILVSGYLSQRNQLDRVGGSPYLLDLLSSTPTAAHALFYAEIVMEKAVLRRLVSAGTRVAELGYSGTEGAEIDVVVDQAQQEVFKVARPDANVDYVRVSDTLEEFEQELAELAENKGKAMGIPTGFKDLDDVTHGLHGGQMVIVAARPGVGKSTLAMDFLRSCSVVNGHAAVIFSLEMSRSEILSRLVSADARVHLSKMRGGEMTERDWQAISDSLERLREVPLFIDDSPNLTMMDIRAKARRLKETDDLQMVVVDYLQLMTSGKRVESRQQEVSEFSRQLKLLAKEIDVPVIAISQLNRGPESRTDKKPQVADLRESGSLEQDADMVMLLYRPDSQNPEDERAGEADVILAKHRGGPITTVTVASQLHYSRFVSMARTAED